MQDATDVRGLLDWPHLEWVSDDALVDEHKWGACIKVGRDMSFGVLVNCSASSYYNRFDPVTAQLWYALSRNPVSNEIILKHLHKQMWIYIHVRSLPLRRARCKVVRVSTERGNSVMECILIDPRYWKDHAHT